jgi:hypothetical protein
VILDGAQFEKTVAVGKRVQHHGDQGDALVQAGPGRCHACGAATTFAVRVVLAELEGRRSELLAIVMQVGRERSRHIWAGRCTAGQVWCMGVKCGVPLHTSEHWNGMHTMCGGGWLKMCPWHR